MLTQADLPDYIDALRALVVEQSRMLAEERAAAEVRLAELNVATDEADTEIESSSRSSRLVRHRSGSRSEQLDADQLRLGLEDAEIALGHARAAREAVAPRPRSDQRRKTNRGSLPARSSILTIRLALAAKALSTRSAKMLPSAWTLCPPHFACW